MIFRGLIDDQKITSCVYARFSDRYDMIILDNVLHYMRSLEYQLYYFTSYRMLNDITIYINA